MEAKKVRLWVFEEWELEQQQAWLTDMAREGWHLSRVGFICTFKQGPPRRMRYRCDVAPEENSDRIELYEAGGWEYVGRKGRVHVFCAPMDANIPEIYTDSTEQAPTLRLLKPNLFASISFMLPIVLLLLFSNRASELILGILLQGKWFTLLAVALMVYMFVLGIRGLFHVHRLNNRLRQGLPLAHDVPYRRLLRNRQVIVPTVMTLAVLLLGNSFVGTFLAGQSDRFPSIPDKEMPIATLSELLDQAGFTDYYRYRLDASLIERAGGDVFNYYREESSLLVPVQQELSERMVIPGVVTDGHPYQPQLVVKRYQAQNNALARLLAQQLAIQKPWLFRLAELQPATPPDDALDGYWQRIEGESFAFILLKDNTVIDVYYNGLEPFADLLRLQLTALYDQP